jgi:divalent metal cation (Fe/Co/Zn/Cd) transporter
VCRLRRAFRWQGGVCSGLLMADDRTTWIRQSWQLALATGGFHFLQFLASAALWIITGSAALAVFGLDAAVSAFASLVLALRIQRSFETLGDHWRSRGVAFGYLGVAVVALFLSVAQLWSARWSAGTIFGIVLAAVSMLVIPIIGSYMKVLAVELRSQPLKAAAIFTFGNSYLSMVLLVALLINAGMGFRWGDAAGGLVMFPFLAQKGLQILIDEGKQEYVEE